MNDLRFALRRLRKNSGFTGVAISSLAIGLALTAAALVTVNAYLLRSFPYPNADRVYHLRYAPPGPWEPRGMTGIDWKSLEDVVEDTIVSSGVSYYLADAGAVKAARGLRISPGFLRGLGIQPVIGRSFATEEFRTGAEKVALIGHALWRDRFGSDPRILERQLPVAREEQDGNPEMLRIVGVLPAGFWFGRDSNARIDVLTPLTSVMRPYMVRLREGVDPSVAERRITDVARSFGSDFRPDWNGVELESVHRRYVESVRPVLLGVSVAVSVVLILVCANVAVLMLLRALREQKEVAVRVALGAERKHLLRGLLIDASLICAAALAVGLILAMAAIRFLTPLIEAQLGRPAPAGPMTMRLDPLVLLLVGGVGLSIALSLAFIPLLAPWQHRLMDALRSQGPGTTDTPFIRRLRASLIAAEVAGSVVLLVGCGLMIRSAVNLIRTDLGFDPERVIRVGVRLPAQTYADAASLYQFYAALTEQLPPVPKSQVALMSAFPPFYPANTQRFEVSGAAADQDEVGVMRVGAGYFDLYGVKLLQGREFTASDRPGSAPVAVLSESFARKLWPDGSAIGRQIRAVEGDMPGSPFGPWRTVVGVVGDVRQGYEDSDLRDLHLPFLQVPGRFASILVRTDHSAAFWEGRVRAAVAAITPYAMVGAATSIVSEDRQRSRTRFLTSMLTGFAVFATLLAALGIYGVTTYAVRQREREIAVRVAVGASQRAIVRMFLRQGSLVLLLGLGAGLCGAFGVAKLLANQVYGVRPFDLATVLTACVLMGVSGLLAAWWPARQAALRDPMSVLKEG